MGSCRCDRSHRESQLGRIDPVTQPLRAELHGLAATESAAGRLAAVGGPARSGTNVAVKIPGRERYVTDSKTAARPSSNFTIHGCQAFQSDFFIKLLQTSKIELQNSLHWLRTRLAVFD